MSKKIQTILGSYHVLLYSTDEALVSVRLDLLRALKEAPLTTEERWALQRKYFSPTPLEAHTGSVGRPRKAETQRAMASIVLGDESKSVKFTRLLQSACKKLSDHLGEFYQDAEVIEMGASALVRDLHQK